MKGFPEIMSMARDKSNNRAGITALVVFIRFPHVGKVKSRLALSLGAEKAAIFYRLCAEQIFGEFSMVSGEVKRYIFFSDRNDESEIKQWAGPRFCFSPQAEGNLGTRLKQAFHQMFDRGMRQVIIMASDVPDLTADVINDAISTLARHDVVLGPSHDGGYYLVGMKRPHDDLFNDIPWSMEYVFKQTMMAIDKLDLSVGCLPLLRDIDTETDLRRWLETAEGDNRKVLEYARAIVS